MSTPESPEPLFQQTIHDFRQAGLKILNPSARDLEAGLALHEDALVVEPYSLGIYAPQDWDRLYREQEAGASAVELRDITEECGMLGHLRDATAQRLYRLAWEASGVNCTFQGAGEEGNDPLRLIKRLARYTHLIDAMPDFLGRAISVREIIDNHHQKRKTICLGLNGVPLAGGVRSVQEELSFVRVFAQLGVRIMHLTYNRRNPIADGCGETSDAGLSAFGRDTVAEMNRLGILIDLAHTGWKSCIEAAQASTQPVVVSHSAAWALNPHIRCKPDEVIRAVAETGGIMSITNVPAFLGGSGDLSALLDHVDYVAQKFGVDAVAIGTDRLCSLPAIGPRDSRVQIKSRPHWEGLWPGVFPTRDPKWSDPSLGQSMAWTNWPLFTVGLLQRGYREEEIRKIVGGNVLRVARAVWKTPGPN